MNSDSPREIQHMLLELGIHLQKKWGQNFLVNRGAREKILGLLGRIDGERVWEIGSGLGALTDGLLEAGQLVLFEIDRKIVAYLTERYTYTRRHVRVISGDCLKTWLSEMQTHGMPDKVVGNLPYRSASAIIAAFAEAGFQPARLVFTVQKELAERVVSKPRRKSYAALSVVCQAAFQAGTRGDLQPGSFYPKPKVTSSILELSPNAGGPQNRLFFSRVVRSLFRSRRKTLRNNLQSSFLAQSIPFPALLEQVDAAGIDAAGRAETLSNQEFIRLADRFYRMIDWP